MEFRARPYGFRDRFHLCRPVREYRRGAGFGRPHSPLLTDPECEQFWPGQAARSAGVVRFTRSEGVSGHCEPMARLLVEQRVFDWLGERIGQGRAV